MRYLGSHSCSGLGIPDEVIVASLAGGALPYAVDATSLKPVPNDATEWTAFRGYHGLSITNPDHLWLMQDVATHFADAIGAINLSKQGGATFGATFAGWDRVGMGMVDGSVDYGLATGFGSDSLLVLMYVGISSVGDSRTVLYAHANKLNFFTDNKYYISSDGLAATATSHGTTVHPILLKVDRTNNVTVLYTDLDKAVPTHASTVTDLYVGGAVQPAVTGTVLYIAVWRAANAETSDADNKALITALGYAPPWS